MNRSFKYAIVTTSALLAGMLLLGSVMGKTTAPDDPYRHLGVLTDVLMKIKSDYVEEPNVKNVTVGAINGLLESVDPFASYLNADQYKSYLKAKGEHQGDVGLILSRRFGYVSVVGSVSGSPAAKAGLSTGDMIETIKGVATRDMPLAYAGLLLKGEPGSTIELTVLRARRNPEPQKISLTRAVLKFPPVESKMLADNIGYIGASSLEAGKVAEVESAAVTLEKQGARKLILDLRDNAWSDPAAGIDLASGFVAKGLLGYLQGQKVPRKNFNATAPKVNPDIPLVVLTNRGTARGAEVAAAALEDSKRAEVVGERTYGYAGLERTVTLDDGSAVILAVAKYYSPAGKSIQDMGVAPTVPVAQLDVSLSPDGDEDSTAAEPGAEAKSKPGDDPILKKAVEVLSKGLQASGTSGSPADSAHPGAVLGPLNVPKNPNRQNQ
ncbi:MAG: PDZ domain-containing protein [Bryobacterales bacterium]|nr:PDZ domain-containing protein [Bryobacterales bacterium]